MFLDFFEQTLVAHPFARQIVGPYY